MLAADQEGGRVQRLKGSGFATIPSARVQAKQSNAALRRSAYDWGRELKDAGINANLAPVADVVPMSMAWVNQPIGSLRRGYDSAPEKVAAKVTAFIEGMDRAGVAAVKHFPGLGRVRGNTDYVSRVVDTRTTRHDAARWLQGCSRRRCRHGDGVVGVLPEDRRRSTEQRSRP